MLNSFDLFGGDIKKSFIFHIPHSRTLIPDYSGFNKLLINDEINLLTDFGTEDIFHINDTTKLVFPYSRIFCDVERFVHDNNEPMNEFGRGFYYTKTDDGKQLRNENKAHENYVHDEYYKPHHKELEKLVDKKLKDVGFVNIIDCHSFNNIPLNTDLNKEIDRPDICIGVDEYHTPEFLIEMIKKQCEKYKFNYKINEPYSGTIVPLKHYKKNKMVNSIMIEINKNLYISKQTNIVDYRFIGYLNKFINELFVF